MTCISNRMEGTEDDILWDSEPSAEREEYDVSADWGTGINITQKEFKQLFSESDESDFEGI